MKHIEVMLRVVLDVEQVRPGKTAVESTAASVAEELRAQIEEMPDLWPDQTVESAYVIRFVGIESTKRAAPPETLETTTKERP